jgi:hypothetical protein
LSVIGEYAFANSLITIVDIVAGSNLRTIAEHAFDNTPLHTLELPTTIMTIGNYAFRFCSGFTGSLTIPSSVTSIGDQTFFVLLHV